MALFTDGPLISAADLQRYENSILSVASIEGIDLAGKIALAQEEIANQLVLFLIRRLPRRDFADLPWAPRPRHEIRNIVVTEPLRQWHAHKALAMVYRDAYNNQLNDRYQGKWTEYEQLAKTSSQNYFQIGVGVAADAIPKPPIPILSTASGSGSAGTFYAAVAWVNDTGQEGALSDAASITTSDAQQLVVTAVNPPTSASGWNAYVGLAPELLNLQNTAPLATNSNWTMVLGLQQGVPPKGGQSPTWFFVDNRVIQRG